MFFRGVTPVIYPTTTTGVTPLKNFYLPNHNNRSHSSEKLLSAQTQQQESLL
jgi:hypothetical protein